MPIDSLRGKTITNAWFGDFEKDFDDTPYLYLEFSDGTTARVEASNGQYTGLSMFEYPLLIEISWLRNGVYVKE